MPAPVVVKVSGRTSVRIREAAPSINQLSKRKPMSLLSRLKRMPLWSTSEQNQADVKVYDALMVLSRVVLVGGNVNINGVNIGATVRDGLRKDRDGQVTALRLIAAACEPGDVNINGVDIGRTALEALDRG